MKILALEFSSSQRSAAVATGGSVQGCASESGGRETRGFALIDSALRQSGVGREEIDCLVVGLGPGSYTGIRIAIAMAQGWQLARGAKLLGISSADCIAAQVWETGIRGAVKVVFDAQQKFFLARYELSHQGCVQVEAFRAMTDADWQCREGEILLRTEAVEKPSAMEKLILPEARMLAKLALGRTDFVNGAALEPLYLRKATFAKAAPPRKLVT